MISYSIQVDSLVYSDKSSRFYIFTGEDLDDPSANYRKVKGNFHAVEPRSGLELEVEGEWEDTSYGPTFVCHKSKPLFLSDKGVRNYLVSAAGMESIHAHKLVDQFGRDGALEKLRNDNDDLYDLSFLEDHEVAEYVDNLDFTESYSDAVKELLAFGVPNNLVQEAYHATETGDIEEIKDDPYLLMEVDNLPFQKIDQIAIKSGIEPDDQNRLSACLEYLLRRAERNGHLYLELASIKKKLNKLPSRLNTPSFNGKLSNQEVWDTITHLEDKGRAVIDDDKIYLKNNFKIEHESAEKLSNMLGSYDLGLDTEDFIEHYQNVHGITFSEEQKEAIRAVNNHKVYLLTGLPGTGKTTSVKALVRLFQKAGKEFDLVCPTGIAAKKLGTVVGEKAQTIHRLLGYDGDTWDFGEDVKYKTDAVIVDESSMIDQQLLWRLLSSLKDDTAIVFVGDHAQLPAVGAGNVLREMIKADPIKQVNLTEIFRQGGTSDIVLNSHRINEGKDLIYKDPTDADTDFRFIPESNPDRIVDGLLNFVETLYNHNDDHSFQVLSPTYKTELGVDNLNQKIKGVLNPSTSQSMERRVGPEKEFREDDRIMVTRNDYEKEVFNGEQGKIMWIKNKEDKMRTKIFGSGSHKIVDFTFDEAKDMLTLSYAMTCHKSQGQEWDYVLFPFHEKFSFQLQRNLLYTAVTRAKEKVFILGQRTALKKAVENDRVQERNTAFAERIEKLSNHPSN